MPTTATAAQIAQVRRMAGIAVSDATYTDTVLDGYITTYPLIDERGEPPYTWDTSTPPAQDHNEDWIHTYDLHAAAADVLEERAATLATEFDFSADGANYSRSQQADALMKQCRYHRSRRSPTSGTLVKWPEEREVVTSLREWIGNLPEPD